MRTSCEIFAENGHPMDSRVPMTFGLVNEPARAILKSDGCLHLTDDEHYRDISWGRHVLPPRKGDGSNRTPKPAISNADARRRANRRLQADKAPIFRAPQPVYKAEPVRAWSAKLDKEPASEPVQATLSDFRKFLETERANNAARRAQREH